MMFDADRDECLEQTRWSTQDKLYFIEAWKYATHCSPTETNYRQGNLNGSEVDDWIKQVGQYTPPEPMSDVGALEGGIRLLFCDRNSYKPPGLSLSKRTYLRVEKALHLPSATMPSLFRYEGICAKYICNNPKSGKAERLDIVVKAPQKIEIANYLLSLSHHFATGWTTALICGDGVITPRAFDKESQLGHIEALVRSTGSCWAHPMILPIIILQNHWRRTELRSNDLDDDVLRLEWTLGVTLSGRLVNRQISAEWPANVDVRAATIGVHTSLTDALFLNSVCDWAAGYGIFLKKTHEILKSEFPAGRTALMDQTSNELWELLEYVVDAICNNRRFTQTLKERVQAQANLLYSVSAQLDNRLNLTIASSSKEDGIAMKTFTFITALFLPGTYVASLFSMSVFDWQGSSAQAKNPTVSRFFWIYWVITIPLTIMVMLGWIWWYRRAEIAYKKGLKPETGQAQFSNLNRQ